MLYPFISIVLHVLLLEVTAPIKKSLQKGPCPCVTLSGVSLAQTYLQWQAILRQTPCWGSRDAESFKSTVPWSNNVKWKRRFHCMNVLNCCNKNCWNWQILYAIIIRRENTTCNSSFSGISTLCTALVTLLHSHYESQSSWDTKHSSSVWHKDGKLAGTTASGRTYLQANLQCWTAKGPR